MDPRHRGSPAPMSAHKEAIRRQSDPDTTLFTFATAGGPSPIQGRARISSPPELDFQLLAETPPHLDPVYLTEGNRNGKNRSIDEFL